MTADSPDKGTPEYNRMIAHLLFTSETEISEKGSRRRFAMVAPTRYFAEITGGLAKDTSRTTLARQLLVGQNYLLLPYIEDLYRLTVLDNLLSAYQENRISKELLEILEAEPGKIPPDYGTDDKAVIIANLMKEGKTDFEPFRRKHDIEANWYMFYRLDFAPLPLYRHSIKQLEAIQKGKRQRKLRAIKAIIRGLLEGHPAIDDIPAQPPKNPAYAGKLAELIEGQYDLRIKEKTPLDWASPYKNVSAGFYINPATGEVKDLRDFTGEINALLSLKSWDYLKEAADAIREAIADWEREKEKHPAKEGLEPQQITVKKTDKLIHAIDKVDENLFAGMFDEKASNQPALFNTVTTKKGQKINVTAYINYEKLPKEITKELTDYDRRVYEAAAAIYNAGNTITTLTQIYYTMGGTGKPAAKQVEKISQSITKMMGTLFHIDNQDEIDNNINYPIIEYDGALLPMERVTATINGKITNAAIHLFREPPLMTFARERKQIFTCDLDLLQSPLNISETKFAIEHCLLSLLAMGKHEAEKEKRKPEQYRKPVKKEMLLETIYQRAKTTDRRTKPRTKEKIITLLTHYKSKGQIKDFRLTLDRVILEF